MFVALLSVQQDADCRCCGGVNSKPRNNYHPPLSRRHHHHRHATNTAAFFVVATIIMTAATACALLALLAAAQAGVIGIVPEFGDAVVARAMRGTATTKYPTVTGHGMGDSCFNSGMKQITQLIGVTTGQYATCVPTGDNVVTDTANGFFM